VIRIKSSGWEKPRFKSVCVDGGKDWKMEGHIKGVVRNGYGDVDEGKQDGVR
jgi:hypothetical protein